MPVQKQDRVRAAPTASGAKDGILQELRKDKRQLQGRLVKAVQHFLSSHQ